VDLLDSISRLAPLVADRPQLEAITKIRELLAAYRDHEDLIAVGAYRPGSNPTVDTAIRMRDAIAQYVRQGLEQACTAPLAREALFALVKQI
jgi:flagellum-specific ATP synthase